MTNYGDRFKRFGDARGPEAAVSYETSTRCAGSLSAIGSGRKMYGEPHKSALYMACGTQRERHDCGQTAVRSEVLENDVEAWLTTLVLPEEWREDIERMQRGIAREEGERPAIDTAHIQHQLDNLKELFIYGDIGREEYVGRSRGAKGVAGERDAAAHVFGGGARARRSPPRRAWRPLG